MSLFPDQTSSSSLDGNRRRKIKIPYEQLQESLIELEEKLDGILNKDLSQLPEDSKTITDFATLVKNTTRSYSKTSRELSSHCVTVGSVNEGQKIREKRSSRQKDAEEIIDSLRSMLSNLGSERISSMDVSSVRSGYSLASDLGPEAIVSPKLNLAEPVELEEATLQQTSGANVSTLSGMLPEPGMRNDCQTEAQQSPGTVEDPHQPASISSSPASGTI